MTDQEYMAQAPLSGPERRRWTSPNPMVGAVIVKDGQVIGQGYHAKCGGPPRRAGCPGRLHQPPPGPPCMSPWSPAATKAASPLYRGHSGSRHRPGGGGVWGPQPQGGGGKGWPSSTHGVQVTEHVLEAQCLGPSTRCSFTTSRRGKPYVVLKYAMTLDGKMAAYTGASQWITGEEARRHVHTQRNRFRSILVGGGHGARR